MVQLAGWMLGFQRARVWNSPGIDSLNDSVEINRFFLLFYFYFFDWNRALIYILSLIIYILEPQFHQIFFYLPYHLRQLFFLTHRQFQRLLLQLLFQNRPKLVPIFLILIHLLYEVLRLILQHQPHQFLRIIWNATPPMLLLFDAESGFF